jgi:hypothetical protein
MRRSGSTMKTRSLGIAVPFRLRPMMPELAMALPDCNQHHQNAITPAWASF